ncbi:MAG TPA: hypothetical protein VGO62_21875 [Myxococcota bacterium]|jgi:hypothetical protein
MSRASLACAALALGALLCASCIDQTAAACRVDGDCDRGHICVRGQCFEGGRGDGFFGFGGEGEGEGEGHEGEGDVGEGEGDEGEGEGEGASPTAQAAADCQCPQLNEVGACFASSCSDGVAVANACSSACVGGPAIVLGCVEHDDSCTVLGLPSGRDAVTFNCDDGTKVSFCAGFGCGAAELAPERACNGGANIASRSCNVDNHADCGGGPEALSCTCVDGSAIERCESLACSDENAVGGRCDFLCGPHGGAATFACSDDGRCS